MKCARGLGRPTGSALRRRGIVEAYWILWDEESVKLVLLEVDRSFIYALVTLKNGKRWTFTAIYASPRVAVRRHLWGKLREPFNKEPWLVMGDFNYVLRGKERSSGVGVSDSFVDWVA